MQEINPLLEDLPLPRFSAVEPRHVAPAIDQLLTSAREQIERLIATPGARTWASLMQPQEDLDDRLSRAFSPVSHLHSVKDSPELRAVYTDALQAITEHETELGQNRALYEAVQAVHDSPEFATLSRAQRTIVDDALKSFRLSGVALEEPARSRFKAIASELSKLASEFEQAVLDATDAWHLNLPDATRLAGLPESALALLRQAAEDAKLPGYRVSLHQPSYVAVTTYADDRELRREIYTAFSTRASDQGPDAGKYDNSARIEKILALRHEAAQLIGFANAAEESLVNKMAPSPQKVLAFLRDLVARARPVAQREIDQLRAFAAENLGIGQLQSWDVAYASEKLRSAQFDLNEEDLKPYFPLDSVLSGMFAVCQQVFGVGLRQRQDVDLWHPDVRFYDVIDSDGQVFAGVYLDLYARTAKRGGAWMDVCRTRRRHPEGVQKPVAFLVCNFGAPTAQQPSLLTHDDVITMFHEFGHGLHHLLTEIDYPSVAGITGVEWDAVELPSQFMENFGWKRQALDLFARHYQTGATLPDDLFKRMQAAKDFQAGMFLVRQLEFGLFDFRLHLEFDPQRGGRVMELLNEVRREVTVLQPPEWQRFPHAFTHIFSGGYSAGYYSYLWAEVLSADAFARFEEAGIFDAAIGRSFRNSVLAVGGSRPALESFVEFRGREPDPAALLRSYGLAA